MSEKFDAVVKRALDNGDEVMSEGFVGNIRQLGSTNLSAGQIIMIADDFVVYKNSQLTTDPKKPVCYAMAQLLNENKEVIGGVPVYPSALNRTLWVWDKDENGNIINTGVTKVPTGAPVDDFNTKLAIQDAFKAIAGKPIKVSKVTTYQTRDFQDKTQLTTQNIYDFEYVV